MQTCCVVPHFKFFKRMFMIILSFGWFPSFLILHYSSKIKNICQFLSLWLILEYPKVVPGLLQWLSGKESACKCRRHGFNPWVEEIPWRRKWQPTPVLLPGKSHRQRSLVGYSPWGRKRVGRDLATKEKQQQKVASIQNYRPSCLVCALLLWD